MHPSPSPQPLSQTLPWFHSRSFDSASTPHVLNPTPCRRGGVYQPMKRLGHYRTRLIKFFLLLACLLIAGPAFAAVSCSNTTISGSWVCRASCQAGGYASSESCSVSIDKNDVIYASAFSAFGAVTWSSSGTCPSALNSPDRTRI